MGSFTKGSVILVSFPFSDLTHSKLRPAVVLCPINKNDFIVCQITSKAYADKNAITIDDGNFERGSLKIKSYVRPTKLFTANEKIIHSKIGQLNTKTINNIIAQLVEFLEK